DQERRCLLGHARLQDAGCALDPRRVLHRSRQQLPDASRWGDAPATCGHAYDSPGADPLCYGSDAARGGRVNGSSVEHPVLDPRLAPPFPTAALPVLRNSQLRKNVAYATDVIQTKRARLVAEKTDWQELRTAAAAIRSHVLERLGNYLEEFEARCTAAGGTVHWASDAAEARAIILELLRQEQAGEVIKIKTMTSAEIQLNPALEAAGIHPYETDLAELILQLSGDEPSHIVVPALHVNRSQVREIFARSMGLRDLPDDPSALTAAARTYLRQKFLAIPTAISGANFLVAE